MYILNAITYGDIIETQSFNPLDFISLMFFYKFSQDYFFMCNLLTAADF